MQASHFLSFFFCLTANPVSSQCQRRSLRCDFPVENRRGMRKRKASKAGDDEGPDDQSWYLSLSLLLFFSFPAFLCFPNRFPLLSSVHLLSLVTCSLYAKNNDACLFFGYSYKKSPSEWYRLFKQKGNLLLDVLCWSQDPGTSFLKSIIFFTGISWLSHQKFYPICLRWVI